MVTHYFHSKVSKRGLPSGKNVFELALADCQVLGEQSNEMKSCLQNWSMGDETFGFCGNPNDDPNGAWCPLEIGSNGALNDFGYCHESCPDYFESNGNSGIMFNFLSCP